MNALLPSLRLALLAAGSLLFATVSCSKKEEPAPPAPTAGGIEGIVSPATAVATVTATSTGNVTFLQTPAASGAFAFANLAPGSYSLTCTPNAGFLAPPVRTVTVVAGQVATAGTIAVDAELPEPAGSIEGVIAPANAVTRVELVNTSSGTVTPAVPDATTGAFRAASLVLGFLYTARFVVAPGYAAVPDQSNLRLGPNLNLNLGIVQVQRSTIALTATINGTQQVPANPSTATGTFVGTYTVATRSLTYRIEYTGLTPSVAHIHTGAPGTNGPVVIPFASLTSPITGAATLSPEQANNLLNNRMYVNIHTTASPAGEIRGNIRQ